MKKYSELQTVKTISIEGGGSSNNNIYACMLTALEGKYFWIAINNSACNNSAWALFDSARIDLKKYYLLKNEITGVLYIRNGKELKSKGLFVDLNPNELQVFNVKSIDAADEKIEILKNFLNGKGINLQNAQDELKLILDNAADKSVTLDDALDFLDKTADIFNEENVRVLKERSTENLSAVKIEVEGNVFLFVFNTKESESKGLVWVREHGTVPGDGEHDFYLLYDILSEKLFIRRIKTIKKDGLYISLAAKSGHIFKLHRIIDKGDVLSVLCEQSKGKAVPITEDWKNILKDDHEIISFSVYAAKLKPKKGSWIAQNLPELLNVKIVYVSMEMFIQEFLDVKRKKYDGAVDANFAGGLGILAGCTMEGFAGVGLDACAVIPMYRERRLQAIGENCLQKIIYKEIDYSRYSNLKKVKYGKKSAQLIINISVKNRSYDIKVWKIIKDRLNVYLLECPEVFDVLYTGDTHKRLLQEIVFGKALPLLLKKLNIKPGIVHLNEAHGVLGAVNMRSWERINDNDNFFKDTRIAFSIHTPRLAGMEVHTAPYKELEIPYGYESLFDPKHEGRMDFTRAAMEIADKVNTVSNNQIKVVSERLFPNSNITRKLIGILNGSSGGYWISRRMKKYLKIAKNKISAKKLWNDHTFDKKEVMREFKTHMKKEKSAKILNINPKYLRLNQKKMHVWLVRRIVDYKQQWPMLKDVVRIMCAPRNTEIMTKWGMRKGLGMQVVVGGMAHPNDADSRNWIREFNMWMKGLWRSNMTDQFEKVPELLGNFFFVPAGDSGLSKILNFAAIGCDLCLEFPVHNEEACGTSGMRALGNGNPSIDSSDGALEWLENGVNGFFLEPYSEKALLEKLQTCSDLYYNWLNKKNKLFYRAKNDTWINIRKQAFITWREKVDINEVMIKRYAKEIFSPIIKAHSINK
ncbi:MAG: glycogen/starch synthase [Elusimicrobiota bacterium]